MDAKYSIDIKLILGIMDSIYKVLDGNLIITIPQKTRLVIIIVVGARVITRIPSTRNMLCKTYDVTTIGIHQTEVTISLQQGCCQLCIRIKLTYLSFIGIGALHHLIRARSHHTASSHQQHSHCKTAFAYIFFDNIVHFITYLLIC